MGTQKTLVVIGGPTAVGKSSIAVNLAKVFDTEILSADSRQCYRELRIGTAKPDQVEQQGILHHFIDSHSIDQTVSAGEYNRLARDVMAEVFEKKEHLVMAGGTGLYIRAALEGIDEMPEVDEGLRTTLNNLSLEELQARLNDLDPAYAAQTDMMNPQRLVRALEVCISSGQPYSSFLNKPKKPVPYDVIKIALTMEREQLYERINRRVDEMVTSGLFEEVEGLKEYKDHYALRTVGYKEIFEYLEGGISHEETVDKIKQNTRRYAKRQLTWFRKNNEFTWFDANDGMKIERFIKEKSHNRQF